MESSIKTITTVLVLATLAFLGYYLFTQKDSATLSLGGSNPDELFVDVQKYIERRTVLNKVQMNTNIFSDKRFKSLEGYPTEIKPQPISRDNPFEEVTIRTIQ